MRNSEKIRNEVKIILIKYGIGGCFLDFKESNSFGRKYWERVHNCEYVSVNLIDECLENLIYQYKPETKFIWLHKYTEETGAILTTIEYAAQVYSATHDGLGPDFLIGDERFRVICVNQQQQKSILLSK